MKNCQEWVIAELGLYTMGGTTAPLYDTLGEENVEFVLKQTAAKTVVCRATEVPKVLTAAKKASKLKAIIVVGKAVDRFVSCCSTHRLTWLW